MNGNISQHATIIRDDARRFLKSTSESFDVIVGDLFHPDLIGRSELLSIQQFRRAKERLNDDGVFVQWLALNQFDLPSFKVVLATFRDIFPDAVLFVDGFRLAMVGVNGEFHGIRAIKDNIAKLDAKNSSEITGGEGVWSWAARYWGAIENVPANSIQDEWAPVIEFQLPKAKFNRQNHLNSLLGFLLRNRQSLEQASNKMQLDDGERLYFEQAYAANNLYYQSWMTYFAGKQGESQRLLSMAYAANPDDQWAGFGMADAMFSNLEQAGEQGISKKDALLKILSIRPDHLSALKLLRETYLEAADVAESFRHLGN